MMGVVNIRLRSEQLGNLGQVRNSAVPDASAAWRGVSELGRGIASLGQSVPQSLNMLAALQEADNDNESSKAAMEYKRRMDPVLYSAWDSEKGQGGAIEQAKVDDTAARMLGDTMKTYREKVRDRVFKDIKLNKRGRELFEQKIFAYDESNSLRAMEVQKQRFYTSSKANAEALLTGAVEDAQRLPTFAGFQGVDDAYTRYAEKMGIQMDSPAFAQGLKEVHDKVTLGFIQNQISSNPDLASAKAFVDNLRENKLATTYLTDEAAAAALQGVWVNLRPVTQQKVIATAEAELNRRAEARVGDLALRQMQGEITMDALKAEQAELLPVLLSPATASRIEGILENQTLREVGAAIDNAVTLGVTSGKVDPVSAFALYEDELPEYVLKSPTWQAFKQAKVKDLAKAFADNVKAKRELNYMRTVHNLGVLSMDVNDQIADLEQQVARGDLAPEELPKAIATVEAYADERTARYAQEARDLMLSLAADGDEAFRVSLLSFGDNGFDATKTLSQINTFFPTKDKTKAAFLVQQIGNTVTQWAQLCKGNASWTSEQCGMALRQMLAPSMQAMLESNLTYPEEAFEAQANLIARVNKLLKQAEPLKDFNPEETLEMLGGERSPLEVSQAAARNPRAFKGDREGREATKRAARESM